MEQLPGVLLELRYCECAKSSELLAFVFVVERNPFLCQCDRGNNCIEVTILFWITLLADLERGDATSLFGKAHYSPRS